MLYYAYKRRIAYRIKSKGDKNMGILDDVVLNAKSVAASVGKKAGQLVDLSKLKLSAADIESDITKKFQTLGKLVYSAAQDKSLASGIDAVIEEIHDLYEQLETVEAQINLMRNKKACPACKKINDADAVYCNACGALLPVQEKEETQPPYDVCEVCSDIAEENPEDEEEAVTDSEEKPEE
jgi:hypothetical protein